MAGSILSYSKLKFLRTFTLVRSSLQFNNFYFKTGFSQLCLNKKFICPSVTSLRICNYAAIPGPYHLVSNEYQTKTSHLKNQNEVKNLLSVPECKLKMFNLIDSKEIITVIETLQSMTKFVKEDDIKKLLELSKEAVKQEIPANRELVKMLWEFLMSLSDFHYGVEQLVDFLSICNNARYQITLKDVLKFMEEQNIEMNEEIAELILANLCHSGDEESVEQVLALMSTHGIPHTEDIYRSLIILNGVIGNKEEIHDLLLAMIKDRIKSSTLTQSATIIAYHLCHEYNNAKEVIETVKKSATIFNASQYSEILSSCVRSGHLDNQRLAEHLAYILDSKVAIAGDIDLQRVILELIHSGFAEEAVHVLLSQHSYKKYSLLNSNGAIFIRELVKAKYKDPATVIQLCNQCCAINANAFYVALETALVEDHTELAWQLLRKLKLRGSYLREHLFWPFFARLRVLQEQNPNLDIGAKTMDVVVRINRLGVSSFGWQTLLNYIIPNLVITDTPEMALEFMSKGGISRNKGLTAMICYFADNLRLEEAVQIARKNEVPFSMEKVTEHLAMTYLKEPQGTLKALESLAQLAKRSEKREQDFVRKNLIPQFINYVRINARSELKRGDVRKTLQDLEMNLEHSELSNNLTLDVEKESEFNDRSQISEKAFSNAENVSEEKYKRKKQHTLEKLSLEELEGHLIELKAKGMNTRGVLRKLLVKYTADNDKEKVERITEELKSIELSPGMLSSMMYNDILNNDAESALQKFHTLHKQFPAFLIDTFKMIDLCCLLVRDDRVKEALNLMMMYIKKTPKDFHQRRAIIKNCHRLLVECGLIGGYSAAREMCSLLLTGGIADASSPLLGPLIKIKLESNDLEGAVCEAEELYSTHKLLPMRVEVLIYLMKAATSSLSGNAKEQSEGGTDYTKLIERFMNIIEKARGLNQAKEDILCAALEIGDVNQVKKIFQSIERNLNTDRIRKLCNHFVRHEKTNALLVLLSISKSSSIVDRMYICESLINIYTVRREGKAALDLWLKMQDDTDLEVTGTFQAKLSRLLRVTATEPV